MGFQENIPGIHERIISQLGVSAVYYPDLNDPVSCQVILKHDDETQISDLDVDMVYVNTTIKALVSYVGTPKQGETFVIGDATYRVARIDSNDKVFVKIVVNEVII